MIWLTVTFRPTKRGDPKLEVPTAALPMVFAYFHESQLGGHLGVFKTINKIRSKFIWKCMEKDIRSRVRACQTCALSKPAQKSHSSLLASDVTQRPMQKIFIDYVGELPRSKAAIRPYSHVLMLFPSSFGWFRLWKLRLERPLRPSTEAYFVVFLSRMY